MQAITDSFDTIDSGTMAQFFDLLKKAYPKAPKIHLILDRGPYNISHVTRETARKRGIELHYLVVPKEF